MWPPGKMLTSPVLTTAFQPRGPAPAGGYAPARKLSIKAGSTCSQKIRKICCPHFESDELRAQVPENACPLSMELAENTARATEVDCSNFDEHGHSHHPLSQWEAFTISCELSLLRPLQDGRCPFKTALRRCARNMLLTCSKQKYAGKFLGSTLTQTRVPCDTSRCHTIPHNPRLGPWMIALGDGTNCTTRSGNTFGNENH